MTVQTNRRPVDQVLLKPGLSPAMFGAEATDRWRPRGLPRRLNTWSRYRGKTSVRAPLSIFGYRVHNGW